MESVVHRKATFEPESELTSLITSIVDRILRNRRFKPMPPQAALTKRQCATSAGVGLSTIEGAIREGTLEARKIGKRTIITPVAFERWLESRPRIKPAAAGADQRELSPSPNATAAAV
jgi:hypothetical protein